MGKEAEVTMFALDLIEQFGLQGNAIIVPADIRLGTSSEERTQIAKRAEELDTEIHVSKELDEIQLTTREEWHERELREGLAE